MIRREAVIFLIVGSLTVLVDFLCYRSLLHFNLSHSLAKGVSFILGTIFSYFANRFWTFNHHNLLKAGSVLRFVLLYLSTLLVNVLINKAILSSCSFTYYNIEIAFLVATSTSALLNFIGMKFFVFTVSESTMPSEKIASDTHA